MVNRNASDLSTVNIISFSQLGIDLDVVGKSILVWVRCGLGRTSSRLPAKHSHTSGPWKYPSHNLISAANFFYSRFCTKTSCNKGTRYCVWSSVLPFPNWHITSKSPGLQNHLLHSLFALCVYIDYLWYVGG